MKQDTDSVQKKASGQTIQIPKVSNLQYWSNSDIWVESARLTLFPAILIMLIAIIYYYWSHRNNFDSPFSLYYSISTGNLLLTRIHYELFDEKVNINNPIKNDNNNRTALLLASYFNQYEISDYLINKINTNVNVTDAELFNSLHYAVYNSNYKLQILLINSSISVNAQDKYRITPLHLAVMKNDLISVKILKWYGNANIELKNSNGQTPIDFAINNVKDKKEHKNLPILQALTSDTDNQKVNEVIAGIQRIHEFNSDIDSRNNYVQFGQNIQRIN